MELWVYLQNDKIGINITHCHVLGGGGIIDLVRVTSIGCSIDRGALQCPSTLYLKVCSQTKLAFWFIWVKSLTLGISIISAN